MSAVPSPLPPNTATIILPPGLTLEQYNALEGHLVTIAIVAAAACGLIIWDYFVLLPAEISLYTERETRAFRVPTTILFVLLRYSGLVAAIPSLFFTATQSRHCQAAVIISQIGAVLAVFSSGAIFSLRVFAIWHGNRAVYALVAFAFATMMGCWIAVAAQLDATTGPPTPFGTNCQQHTIPPWSPISYGSSVFFDTTILVLTVVKLPRNLTHKSLVGRQIFRDTLMYFSITAMANIVVVIIQSLGATHALLKPAVLPFSTVMTVTMGSRVYLNLKLLQTRRQADGGSQGIPLSVPRPDKNRTGTSSGASLSQGEAALPNRGFAVNQSAEDVGKLRTPLTLDDASA